MDMEKRSTIILIILSNMKNVHLGEVNVLASHMLAKTKAETLEYLAERGYPVPQLLYFSLREWRSDSDAILTKVEEFCADEKIKLAVRSSARAEDGIESSHAGEFLSVLNLSCQNSGELKQAVEDVAECLCEEDDQIIVQHMAEDVIMAGVVTTHTLGDGSPYYVVNYDDTSGKTDTVTGGTGAVKTVYIHRGVQDRYFDSPRLRKVVDLARRLEKEFDSVPLDIEFAVNKKMDVYLLQARRICSVQHWDKNKIEDVTVHITRVAEFIRESMSRRGGLHGARTILGVMPDWNPAEILGIAPRPLAFSLYRELITRRVWSQAREVMGYRKMPPVELMLYIGGRPYIDVRASFNSFLPEALSESVGERLVTAWLERLDKNPDLHDKIEFEIVHTVAEPGLKESFLSRYPGLLTEAELAEYYARLQRIAIDAMSRRSTLATAMECIDRLAKFQEKNLFAEKAAAASMNSFDLVMRLSQAIEACKESGTFPFAIAARHGFIAETILRAAIRNGALTQERVGQFKKSVRTISGELTRDFRSVLRGELERSTFLRTYGHLRPGTYDILSPTYAERLDLFDSGCISDAPPEAESFVLHRDERKSFDDMLSSAGFGIDTSRFLDYAGAAIAGREYAKFIFSRHLSHILDLVVVWGGKVGLSRDDLSMLPISDILEVLHKPLPLEGASYFRRRIDIYREEYRLGRLFEMAYLIRSERDVYIVPQHRSAPNFITAKRMSAPIAYLDAHAPAGIDLSGRIVCIESADPGYDWIFTREPIGLITRYGGTNSHMAIRCAEYALPAAIGCGELIFERIRKAGACLLDCGARTVSPLYRGPQPHQREKA